MRRSFKKVSAYNSLTFSQNSVGFLDILWKCRSIVFFFFKNWPWSIHFRQRSSQPDSNKFDPFLLESGWLNKWPCLVNPIPTKSTRFQQRKSTRFQQSQPDSDKVLWVNPIPTKVESTRFQQISQPDYS